MKFSLAALHLLLGLWWMNVLYCGPCLNVFIQFLSVCFWLRDKYQEMQDHAISDDFKLCVDYFLDSSFGALNNNENSFVFSFPKAQGGIVKSQEYSIPKKCPFTNIRQRKAARFRSYNQKILVF